MQERMVREKTPEQALNALMRLCAKSEHSTGDAMRLMNRWHVAQEKRHEVLDKLIKLKFIDNRRFAEAYTRDKLRFQGWGKRKIRSGLMGKGIEREIIEAVLAEVESDDSQLMRLLAAKKRTVKATDEYQMKIKLMRFALGRGFEYEAVADCIEKIMNNEDTDED